MHLKKGFGHVKIMKENVSKAKTAPWRSTCIWITMSDFLTLCGPLWLLYVSRKIAKPVKKSLLPKTGPVNKKNIIIFFFINNILNYGKRYCNGICKYKILKNTFVFEK